MAAGNGGGGEEGEAKAPRWEVLQDQLCTNIESKHIKHIKKGVTGEPTEVCKEL